MIPGTCAAIGGPERDNCPAAAAFDGEDGKRRAAAIWLKMRRNGRFSRVSGRRGAGFWAMRGGAGCQFGTVAGRPGDAPADMSEIREGRRLPFRWVQLDPIGASAK
jgi:hypothetical protein